MRGATTSFEPAHYFGNADADVDKWEALFERLASTSHEFERALDVGCGTGAYLSFLTNRRPDVTAYGIELDVERSTQARAANPRVDVRTGDAVEALASTTESFDLITLWDVFEHVTRPGALLEMLAARLAPGGSLYIQTIHESSLLPAVGRWLYKMSGGAFATPIQRTHEAHHLVFFTQTGLDLLIRNAGLVVREQWYDRLAMARMDGSRLLAAAAASALRLENAMGNGLFVNLLLEHPQAGSEVQPPSR